MGRLDATRRVPVWGWLVLGVAGLVLVGLAFVVEVQVIFITPDLGDVSGLVGAIATTLSVFATLAAFAIAVYNEVTDDPEEASGPERGVTIAGENNDVTIYLGIGDEESSGTGSESAVHVPANEETEDTGEEEREEPADQDEYQDSN